jgi:hypothetical protein
LKHLRVVGLNYFTHAGRALFYSGWLLALSVAAFVHALFPTVFIDTTSDGVAKIDISMGHNPEDIRPELTD